MKHGKSYLISPSNDDFIIFVAAQLSESSPPYRQCRQRVSRMFHGGCVLGVVTAIDVFSGRAGSRVSGLTGSVLCTTITLSTRPGMARSSAAAASRSFLTEPSALLRRNITSTCGGDGDSNHFIKSSF